MDNEIEQFLIDAAAKPGMTRREQLSSRYLRDVVMCVLHAERQADYAEASWALSEAIRAALAMILNRVKPEGRIKIASIIMDRALRGAFELG